MSSTWESLASTKRAALTSSIPAKYTIPPSFLPPASQLDVTTWPSTSGWFTDSELAITSLSAVPLLRLIAAGTYSSLEVTKVFIKRACAAHQLTNCLSETLFPAALARAAELDAYFQSSGGKTVGPLHGLPFSLKDNFNVRGLDATVGFAAHVNKPAEYDAILVEMLRDAGAVFYVKTNVPTAMMIAESVNHVFGRTVNPRNRNLTSGGSSGGESALIAFGGSPLGVGTDIGGSLRIPAACTGIFTLRPSFGRFPTGKCRSGMPGQEAVQSVNGPMARTLEDVVYHSRTVVGMKPWERDPKCVPVPWRAEMEKLPLRLRVGVLWDDGVVVPTPPVTRALRTAVEKLKAAGHEVVEWAPWREEGYEGVTHQRGAELLQRMFVADGGKAIREMLEETGEPWREEMLNYSVATELGTRDMWKLHLERTEFQTKYLELWGRKGLDCVLAPTTPCSTVPHGGFKYVGYTGVFNILDYACVSFPSGITVDKVVDAAYPEGYTPLSDTCKAIHDEYNAEVVQDMPVNLQIIARRLEEEKALAITGLVGGLLGSESVSPSLV